jgi:hypothetical protein
MGLQTSTCSVKGADFRRLAFGICPLNSVHHLMSGERMMTLRRQSLSLILLAIVTACADNVSSTGRTGNAKPDFRVRATGGDSCLCNTSATLWGQSTLPNHIYSVVTSHANAANPVVDNNGNLYWIEGGNGAAMHIWMKAKSGGNFFGKEFVAEQAQAVSPPLGLTYQFDVDSQGNIFFPIQNSAVYVLPIQSGTFFNQTVAAGAIGIVAGTGSAGFSGDGGPAISAQVKEPGAVAIDSVGNLFISDSLNHRIRVVAKQTGSIFGVPVTENNIYTVAGTGAQGFDENPIPANSVTFNTPQGIFIDNKDNLYISDAYNGAIRAMTRLSEPNFFGYPTTTPNQVYTIAGHQHTGMTSAGDGGPAKNAIFSAWDVAVDSKGNLYIPDLAGRVRFVPRTCGIFWGQYMVANNIYPIAGLPIGYTVSAFFGDGDLATSAALYVNTYGINLDPSDNLYIGDHGNGRIRFVPNCGDSVIPQPTPVPTASNTYCVEPPPQVAPPPPTDPLYEGQLLDVGYDKDGNVFYGVGSGPYRNWAQYFMRPVNNGFFFGRSMTAGQPTAIAGSERGNWWYDNGTADATSFGLPGDTNMAFLTLDSQGNFYTTAELARQTGRRQVLFVARNAGMNFNTHIPAGYAYRLAGSVPNGGPVARDTAIYYTGDLCVDPSGNVLVGTPEFWSPFMVGAATGNFFGFIGVLAGNIYGFNTNSAGYYNSIEHSDLIDGGEFKHVPPSVNQFSLDAKGNLYFMAKSGYASSYSPPPPVHSHLWIRPAADGRYFGRDMQANHVYKIAGGGASHAEGVSGRTSHIVPWDLSVDRNGNVLFTDGKGATGRVRFVASETNPGNFAYGTGVNPGCVYSLIGGSICSVDPLPNLEYAQNLDVHASGKVLFTGYLKGDNKQKLWDIPLAP